MTFYLSILSESLENFYLMFLCQVHQGHEQHNWMNSSPDQMSDTLSGKYLYSITIELIEHKIRGVVNIIRRQNFTIYQFE